MPAKTKRASRSRILLTSVLILRCAGCGERRTPFGTGPQKDPAREAARLNYLINTKSGNPDQIYQMRVRLAEIDTQARYGHMPDLNEYLEIVKATPDRPEARVSYARALVGYRSSVGRWFKNQQMAGVAGAWMSQVIEKDPKNGEYYLLSAQVSRVYTGGVASALDLSKAAQLLGNDPRVKVELAEDAVLEDQFASAVRHLGGIGQVPAPMQAETHYLRGRIEQEKGDVAGALGEYKTALSNNPNHADAQAAATLILWAQSSPELESNIRRLAQISGSYPDLGFYQAMRMWNSGHYSMALDSLENLSNAYPANLVFSRTYTKLKDQRDQGITNFFAGAAALMIVAGTAAALASHDNSGGYPSDNSTGNSSGEARNAPGETDTEFNLRRQQEAEAQERQQQADRDRTNYLNYLQQQQEQQRRDMANYRARQGY